MIKRTSMLTGLAMLGVIAVHASIRGLPVMFYVSERYSYIEPGLLGNHNPLFTLPFNVIVVNHSLVQFSIPAFLFASGFFAAYAFKGVSSQEKVFSIVRSRIIYLIVPYIIWSVAYFVSDWLFSCVYECQVGSWFFYLKALLMAQADPSYWFVPVICQFYILAPWLVRCSEKCPRLLLLGSLGLHLLGLIVINLSYIGILDNSVLSAIFKERVFARNVLYFVLGISAFNHQGILSAFLKRFSLKRFRVVILATIASFAFLSTITGFFIFFASSGYTLGGHYRFFAPAFSLMTIVYFLSSEKENKHVSSVLHQISRRSYGIYLLHPIVMDYLLLGIAQSAPTLLGFQPLFMPIMIAGGIGIPFLFMSLIANTRARIAYRYLFG